MLDSRATHNLGHRPGLPNKKLGGVCMTMTKRLPRYLDDHQDLGTTYKRGQLAIHGFTSYIYIYIYIIYCRPNLGTFLHIYSPGVAIIFFDNQSIVTWGRNRFSWYKWRAIAWGRNASPPEVSAIPCTRYPVRPLLCCQPTHEGRKQKG